MRCDRCGETIPAGEEMQYFGQTLCEECYMQALSPALAIRGLFAARRLYPNWMRIIPN
jgi:hypothetical protein